MSDTEPSRCRKMDWNAAGGCVLEEGHEGACVNVLPATLIPEKSHPHGNHDRDILLGAADALRKLAADREVRAALPSIAPRLEALGNSIERALLANAFSQPPTLKEWRRMVEGKVEISK